MHDANRGLTAQVGPLEVDVPRSAGYLGGVGLAVGLGLIDPPLGVFIAAIPFLKLLNRPTMSTPVRTLVQFYEGMTKPVGGDSEGTITLAPGRRPVSRAPAAARRRTGPARRPASRPRQARPRRSVGG